MYCTSNAQLCTEVSCELYNFSHLLGSRLDFTQEINKNYHIPKKAQYLYQQNHTLLVPLIPLVLGANILVTIQVF